MDIVHYVGRVLVVTELSPYGDLLKYLKKVAKIGLGVQERYPTFALRLDAELHRVSPTTKGQPSPPNIGFENFWEARVCPWALEGD